MKGWIYIMTNPSFANGLIKIGQSQDPERRRIELSSSTSAPLPFKLEYKALVANYVDRELDVHKSLARFRTNESREYFNCSIPQAIATIRHQCQIEAEKVYFQDEAAIVAAEERLNAEEQERKRLNQIQFLASQARQEARKAIWREESKTTSRDQTVDTYKAWGWGIAGLSVFFLWLGKDVLTSFQIVFLSGAGLLSLYLATREYKRYEPVFSPNEAFLISVENYGDVELFEACRESLPEDFFTVNEEKEPVPFHCGTFEVKARMEESLRAGDHL